MRQLRAYLGRQPPGRTLHRAIGRQERDQHPASPRARPGPQLPVVYRQAQDRDHRSRDLDELIGAERALEDARGAAAEHRLHPRDDRSAQGDADDRRPLPALRLPAPVARADRRGDPPRFDERGDRDRGRSGRRDRALGLGQPAHLPPGRAHVEPGTLRLGPPAPCPACPSSSNSTSASASR